MRYLDTQKCGRVIYLEKAYRQGLIYPNYGQADLLTKEYAYQEINKG